MHVIPAIDLRGGRCVRLRQGDYDRETVFGDDPAAMAARWEAEGATLLHLVDLDGARDGRPVNVEAVEAILDRVKVPCQLGGGVRDDAALDGWLATGVERVVVGTQALKDPDWFRAAARRYPERVVLGLDARDGRVATEGWLDVSSVEAVTLAEQFDDLPLAAVVYTDISRDGMLEGPNLAATEALARRLKTPVVASGGVSTLEDITRLAALPVAGCIVGRALYEGRFRLREAIERAEAQPRAAAGRRAPP
ncbi:MAG TPA: 1-(5-phosphoribosyl)-5-[(5-phosphoribosylamino)methylideneamino]imidazole-4-carboxamide isomerase [Isosphaeraceae bacterium]|nr:1-(5-phosphoribosyl)-5-[(5-phosphoribosylamino)methylideneamino]imidazole-4-carboxamide isomerase [Isosphaeraceae bacterium]